MKVFIHTLCFFLYLLPCCISAENITVIGVGRLGLCLALCLERAGHQVLGVDVFPDYIAELNAKTFQSPEPRVVEFLRESRNFRATTSLKEGLAFSDLCLITVSTTTGTQGYDFTMLTQLLADIRALIPSPKNIVICSTVSPGYIETTALPLLSNCTVSYNPPFIAQGEIIKGLQTPDIVLIGAATDEMGERLEAVYKRVCINAPYMARMSVQSAEITKLALNCFVTAKIAFANLVGDIADETPGADKFAILKALGEDLRIGSKCILPGYGFGGPCFPRDNRALSRYALSKSIEPTLFQATDLVNALHANYMAKKLLEQNLDEYVFEDVCYKSKCPVPIIEESQKLEVALRIAEQGKKVLIADREAVISQVERKHGKLFHYFVTDTDNQTVR